MKTRVFSLILALCLLCGGVLASCSSSGEQTSGEPSGEANTQGRQTAGASSAEGGETAEPTEVTETPEPTVTPVHVHSFGSWSTSQAATCYKEGKRERTCSSCKEKESAVLPALGHDFVNGVCSRCGVWDPAKITKGTEIKFGAYKQTDDSKKTKDSIDWIVLDVVDGKVKLLSKYALNSKAFSDAEADNASWTESTLRTWLNNEFYDAAFGPAEKELIVALEHTTENNPVYGTPGGETTLDRVTLPDLSDVVNADYGFAAEYTASDAARRCKATAYARATEQGCWSPASGDDAGYCRWWLLTPGSEASTISVVQVDGSVYAIGCGAEFTGVGVRPVVWVDPFSFDDYPASTAAAEYQPSTADDTLSKDVTKGSTVFFGTYEQDGDKNNGKEKIEWIVLDVSDGKALLLSKYVLDASAYHKKAESVTWETSDLHKWLKDTFYKNAFDSKQQKKIVSSKLSNEANPEYATEGGKDTTDTIFLLSLSDITSEALGFNPDASVLDEVRKCTATAYAISQGCWAATYPSFENNCWWWVRSPGSASDRAAVATFMGKTDFYGVGVSEATGGVRPAIWVTLA